MSEQTKGESASALASIALGAEMREPWYRDLVLGIIAEHSQDVRTWAGRVAFTYSRSGSLEVSAVIWALLAQLDAPEPRS